jgi:hypothetical protein
MRKAVALCHLLTYTVQETTNPHRNQLLPDDLGLRGLNDGFIMYGMRLRLSICVFVKCYKVASRSGYQKGRRSASSNWIYRTGPRLGRIEKRFVGVSPLS